MTLQQAKNALVASLFELSNAATSAATATVDFYKQAGLDGAEQAGSQLKDLSASIAGAADSVATTVTTLSNGNSAATPRKRAPRKKVEIDTSKAEEPKVAEEPPTPSQPKAKATPAKSKAKEPVAVASDSKITETIEVPDEKEKDDKTERAERAEKPKKKRAEKDPNAPKKPLTSYLRFNLQIRDSLRKERAESGQPTFQATELNQIIADKWANLTSEDKARLQLEYETDFEAYKKNLEKYKLQKQLDENIVAATEAAAADAKEAGESSIDVSEPVAAKSATVKPAAPAKPTATASSSDAQKAPETKAEKKRKAKAAAAAAAAANASPSDAPTVSSTSAPAEAAASTEENPTKKSKKRKDKEADDKKLKKKKNE